MSRFTRPTVCHAGAAALRRALPGCAAALRGGATMPRISCRRSVCARAAGSTSSRASTIRARGSCGRCITCSSTATRRSRLRVRFASLVRRCGRDGGRRRRSAESRACGRRPPHARAPGRRVGPARAGATCAVVVARRRARPGRARRHLLEQPQRVERSLASRTIAPRAGCSTPSKTNPPSSSWRTSHELRNARYDSRRTPNRRRFRKRSGKLSPRTSAACARCADSWAAQRRAARRRDGRTARAELLARMQRAQRPTHAVQPRRRYRASAMLAAAAARRGRGCARGAARG